MPSTNDTAAALLAMSPDPQGTAKSRPPEGTVVRADSQSAGRGQFGSRWESAARQNLTLSIVLYPKWLEINAQFYLSMTIALALEDTASACLGATFGEQITSKWPNDLYFADRKAGGILIQNTLSGSEWSSAIVGIGLNVNQLEFPPNVGRATSLAKTAGRPFDLDTVAEMLFECVERRYLQLKSGKKADIKQEYEAQLYRCGLPTVYRRPTGETFQGIIQGVQPDGRLRMETDRGLEIFNLKELAIV
ncbi:MAG: biotin--[acetyl-CoA-carboxylase] ligase [Saprospiraceae bacterium]